MSDPTIIGILNTQTISYVGFAILGIFLLTIIGWGIIQLFKGGGDLLGLAITGVTGAILIILAYIIIYNLANIYIVSTPENDSLEGYEETYLMNDFGILYVPKQLVIPKDIPVAAITNLRLCADDTIPCKTSGLITPNVMVYWEVEHGVGCCNSFGCSYQVFTDFCGSPFTTYRLYDIALDGTRFKWGTITEWDYECSLETPWNFFYYKNITTGLHNITIWQKDCKDVVDTAEIIFYLADSGDGTYAIIQ